jgi:hypothetical protein
VGGDGTIAAMHRRRRCRDARFAAGAVTARHETPSKRASPEIATGKTELVAVEAAAYTASSPHKRHRFGGSLMLEAHIVSPRGSLYYAGEAHPYDLEMLWLHLRDARFDIDRSDVRLELIVHDDGIEPSVARWIRRVSREGIQVQMLFSRLPPPEGDAQGEDPIVDDPRVAV